MFVTVITKKSIWHFPKLTKKAATQNKKVTSIQNSH